MKVKEKDSPICGKHSLYEENINYIDYGTHEKTPTMLRWNEYKGVKTRKKAEKEGERMDGWKEGGRRKRFIDSVPKFQNNKHS